MFQQLNERESVKVLRECIELQLKKSQDYQNPNSQVKQAMHYRRGVDTIYDIMHGKMLRIESLMSSGSQANYESLEDSFKDLINYASFAVSYIRGKMEGQEPDRDMFNRKIMTTSIGTGNLTFGVDANKVSGSTNGVLEITANELNTIAAALSPKK